MTTDILLEVARNAQMHWDCVDEPVLIGHRENAVFRATPKHSSPIALRLHRIGYQSAEYIEGEMIWTELLAQAGFPCSTPVRTKDGALIVSCGEGQLASAVTWIDAKPLAELNQTEPLYLQLGQLLRRLHDLSDGLNPAINRPSWDAKALLGDTPSWGRFWENPSLSIQDIQIVQGARNTAKDRLTSLKNLDTGLIHADAISENVLSGDQLHLIDFDDSGYGYRLYDLGVALIQHENSPRLPNLTQAICEGYGTSTDYIPLFMMLRAMASAGWIISRAPKDDPRQRLYADRMLRCIAAFQNS